MSQETTIEQPKELTSTEILAKRYKYLYALAVSLGINHNAASKRIKSLLKKKTEFSKANIAGDLDRNDSKSIQIIQEAYCELFEGKDKRDSLSHPIGSTIIVLITKDVNSGYFEHLPSWIGYWTDGNALPTFEKLLNKEIDIDKELGTTKGELLELFSH